jgi:hypothetical protein
MDEQEKKVDSEWKEQVEKQKVEKQPAAGPGEEIPAEAASFSFFLTSLAMQAAIALGQMPNPVTQKMDENLGHAKLIIDTLGMLKEKTQGNLSSEEDSLIDSYLYDLRLSYLSKTKEGKK